MTSPFFVIGSPRSGTTMLRLMLTSHPKLVVPPECGFLLWLQPKFGLWSHAEFSSPANLASFADAVAVARKFDTWRLPRGEVITAITKARPFNYADACAAIYRLYAEGEGKPDAIWGDKNNYYLAHIATLKSIYRSARFLHIVRDGRDVACSYREIMSHPSNSPYKPDLPVAIAEIARKWLADVQSIRAQFALQDHSDTLETRYEDLVSAPERELGRICEWLGVAFTPQMLQFHEANRIRQLEPAETMDWKRRTLEPVSLATIGRHTQMLTSDELREFAAIAGVELREYGYLN